MKSEYVLSFYNLSKVDKLPLYTILSQISIKPIH